MSRLVLVSRLRACPCMVWHRVQQFMLPRLPVVNFQAETAAPSPTAASWGIGGMLQMFAPGLPMPHSCAPGATPGTICQAPVPMFAGVPPQHVPGPGSPAPQLPGFADAPWHAEYAMDPYGPQDVLPEAQGLELRTVPKAQHIYMLHTCPVD